MSFILSQHRIIGKQQETASNFPVVTTLRDQTKFVLPSGKIVSLLNECIIDQSSGSTLCTDAETYLLNSQKKYYLENVDFYATPILYWLRPETGLYLAVRHAIQKISGVDDYRAVEHILQQNMGILDYFANFLKINTNVFQFSLQKRTGIPDHFARYLLSSLIEYIHYQKYSDIQEPVIHNKLLKELFNSCLTEENCELPSGTFDRNIPNEITMTSHYFHCFVCQNYFNNSRDLREHIKTHKTYMCTSCEIEFENYMDLSCHCITFCRAPHSKKSCSFCQKNSKECTCRTFFRKTVEEVKYFLQDYSSNKIFSQYVFSDIFQYFHDEILDMTKFKCILSIDDNNETAEIPDDIWPSLSLLDTSDSWDNEVTTVLLYNESIKYTDIKLNIINYDPILNISERKVALMDYMRDTCLKRGCTLPTDVQHYFQSHLVCPISNQGDSDEVQCYLSNDEFYEHLSNHNLGWEMENTQLICSTCQFSTKDPKFLPIILAHAFQHKYKDTLPKCNEKTSFGLCASATFGTLQDFVNHILTFHFSSEVMFRNMLIKLLKFDRKTLAQSDGPSKLMTPKVKTVTDSKSLPALNVASGSKSKSTPSVIKKGVTTLPPIMPKKLSFLTSLKHQHNDNEESEDDNDNYDHTDDNDSKDDNDDDEDNDDNKDNVNDSQGGSKLNTSSHNGNGKGYFCRNESHQPPMQFPTKAQKELHIMKNHKCFYDKCTFFDEFDSKILQHYKQTHLKSKQKCALCQEKYTNKEEHYEMNHEQCPSCKIWLLSRQELQSHELTCGNLVDNVNVPKVEDKKFVASKNYHHSLMIDQSNVEVDFSKVLINLIENSNISQSEKQASKDIISRHASESVITKNRLRGDGFSNFKSYDLLFDLPNWSETGRENVSKLQTYLGVVKESDIFNKDIRNSKRDSIANFEFLDLIMKRIDKCVTLCNLSEPHGIIILQGFLHQKVQDSLSVYNRTDFSLLSFKTIVESLQFLYCPIRLDILETKVMSYTMDQNEDIFVFASKCQRHLSLISRKLPVQERASYIESHLTRLLKTSLPNAIRREIDKKENVFSAYNSQEIMELWIQYSSKTQKTFESYDVLFTKAKESKIRGTTFKDDKKQKKRYNKGRVQKIDENKEIKISEDSKRRLMELGPKYSSGGIVCFRCLSRLHLSSNCDKYSGSLPDKLCFRFEGGKKRVCGYHFPCKEKSFQNLKVEQDQKVKPGNPSIWGKGN